MRFRHPFHARRPGYLLLETILAIALFGLFLLGVGTVLLQGQERTIAGGDRVRATEIAVGELEAARAIRDGAFSSLAVGQHGVLIGGTGLWTLAGTGSLSNAQWASLAITDVPGGAKRLLSAVTWWRGSGTGKVQLSSELSDWRGVRTVGDWSSLSQLGSTSQAGATFTSGAMKGSTLFVGAESTPGLFVYDISSPASPTRIATSFSLGVGVRSLAVRGDRLYVLTTDSSAELKLYDISDPSSLSSSSLVSTYNLPGSDRGLSLQLGGDLLLASAQGSTQAGEDQLYLFDALGSGALVLRGSAHGSADANAVGLSGTSAYLATSNITAELGVVDAEDPAHPTYATGEGFNVTGSLTGLAVKITGSAAILGQLHGTSNVVRFDVSQGGVPPSSPSPLYHQASGSVVGIDTDATGCFAFLAARTGHAALQVMRLNSPSLPEVAAHDAPSGQAATAILYDLAADRLILLTDHSVLLFGPGSSPSPCQ